MMKTKKYRVISEAFGDIDFEIRAKDEDEAIERVLEEIAYTLEIKEMSEDEDQQR